MSIAVILFMMVNFRATLSQILFVQFKFLSRQTGILSITNYEPIKALKFHRPHIRTIIWISRICILLYRKFSSEMLIVSVHVFVKVKIAKKINAQSFKMKFIGKPRTVCKLCNKKIWGFLFLKSLFDNKDFFKCTDLA